MYLYKACNLALPYLILPAGNIEKDNAILQDLAFSLFWFIEFEKSCQFKA